MTQQRKTRPGEPLHSIGFLLDYIAPGNWVYLDNKKPMHPSWVLGMKLRTVVTMLDKGRLRMCESADDDPAVQGGSRYYRTSPTCPELPGYLPLRPGSRLSADSQP